MFELLKHPKLYLFASVVAALSLLAAGEASAETDTTEVASAVVKVTLVVMLVRWLWRMLT